MRVKFQTRRGLRVLRCTLVLLVGVHMYSCTTSRSASSDHTDAEVSCEAITYILSSPDVKATLLLDESPELYSKVRVFAPHGIESDCVEKVGNWDVKYYTDLKPSLNTGYHRDVVIYHRSDLNPKEYQVYVPSHAHYKNRQTTYLFRFTYSNDTGLSVGGFAEYTDH